ncbi:hypothetical protein HPB47_000494 [Ixodes persulcatus]|uniref:Uncharacterized protein n=1 Tax=Ixodes persulcatus TaxID=34615 RepID=A0AC60PT12_IXOPE|nr:hypothetical protein HPB47_000494 [Ixodes persulcatus]
MPPSYFTRARRLRRWAKSPPLSAACPDLLGDAEEGTRTVRLPASMPAASDPGPRLLRRRLMAPRALVAQMIITMRSPTSASLVFSTLLVDISRSCVGDPLRELSLQASGAFRRPLPALVVVLCWALSKA